MAAHKITLTVSEEDHQFLKANYMSASRLLQAKIAEERGKRTAGVRA